MTEQRRAEIDKAVAEGWQERQEVGIAYQTGEPFLLYHLYRPDGTRVLHVYGIEPGDLLKRFAPRNVCGVWIYPQSDRESEHGAACALSAVIVR